MSIINALNNREIAIAIWLTIFFLWAVSKNSVRRSILNVFKAFFNKKIIIPLLSMLLYIVLMVLVFKKIGFWDISATKDTILWTLGSAFSTFININKAGQEDNYFKNLLVDNLKFVLLLEFIVNLYSFNLVTELIIIPIISFVVMLNGYTESKPEYQKVRNLFNYILGIFGLILVVFTFREIVLDFQNFASLKNLRDFFLPLLFSIALFPFVYIMALIMHYETFFIRIDIANNDPDVVIYAKRKLLAACHINFSKLKKVSRKAGYPKVNDKEDVLEWFKKEEQ